MTGPHICKQFAENIARVVSVDGDSSIESTTLITNRTQNHYTTTATTTIIFSLSNWPPFPVSVHIRPLPLSPKAFIVSLGLQLNLRCSQIGLLNKKSKSTAGWAELPKGNVDDC